MKHSKGPAPGPAMDMFADEDQNTSKDASKENPDQQGQDCVGKTPKKETVFIIWIYIYLGNAYYGLIVFVSGVSKIVDLDVKFAKYKDGWAVPF